MFLESNSLTPHSHSIFLFQHLSHVRPVSIKDMEKFTSPWAVAAEDEEKFARTVSSVGRLLRDDLHLQVKCQATAQS